ncbi:MAG: thioredoxin fold domain-containing protein [Gammaproteobacteria bacterium]|nr:thioredoxin fold domain-containing protein [Gammaproteobacteria bacterium]
MVIRGFGRTVLLGAGVMLALVPLALPAAEKTELRGARPHEVPAWFKSSFLVLSEDVAEAAQNGKRLMVYFGQDGCPYCAELFNNNFSQAHIVDYTRRHFDAIDINLWGSREVTDFSGKAMPEKDLAANLKVWFTPTLLFFNEQGEQVLRINGYYPPHQFLTALKYVAEKQEKRMTFKEYLAGQSPPPARGLLQPQPFFAQPPHDLSRVTGGKPVAVFFEQKDCTGCDRLHDVVFKEAATLDQIKRFHVIQLDRWSDMPVVTPEGKKTTARAWADSLNVSYVPTAVLYDGKKEVIRIEAMLKGFHVQSVLDYAASGAYKTQPSLQRFIQTRADHLREQGVVVDIWN